MGEIILDFLRGFFAVVLGRSWQKHRATRGLEHGRFECGFRVVIGAVPGLSTKWQHGSASLSDGVVCFQPRRSRQMIEFKIDSTHAESRRPTGRETWSVSSASRLIPAAVGSSRIECAVMADQVDSFLTALQRS